MEDALEKSFPLSCECFQLDSCDVSDVTIYPQLLKNVRVTDKKEANENPAVQAAVKAVEEALGSDGRILVRESGTEPLIRVMVEAESEELCARYVGQVVEVLEAEGLVE